MKPIVRHAAGWRLALAALGVCGALAASCRTGGFVTVLPTGMPDVSSWERSTGSAELESPRRSVAYELFVHPDRPAVYSVTRYRIRLLTPDAAAIRLGWEEKLQWDRDGKDVRRYLCEAPAGAAGRNCRWRELPRGSAEYDLEMPAILSIYALHARLLSERDAGRLR